MILGIKAPKATQVKATSTPLESDVEIGDVLIELHDFEEARILSQIGRAIEENRIKKSEAEGRFVQEKIEALRQIRNYRATSLAASQAAYEGIKAEADVGQKTLLDVLRARQNVAIRSYMVLQSSVESEIYERNASDSVQVFDHVELLLLKEREYVERCRARLTIRAPRRGWFKRYVNEGTPVRIGHLLGEIH
ncbi:hypothetical protein GOB36_30015 [Sinorhizobium meliloti]|uniref:hypothetical protein n=1 Tax=Rhizobium meliloti TaxID=382 RepID=UPI00299D6F7F|nr:hypothetical protein [Sinorhizobium meliloti]MDX0036005.1 hypothetical protein [Sinorhizobium meliloti]